MSRKKLIEQLKKKNPQINQSEIEKLLDIFSESILNSLKNKDNVEIRGFGSFYSKILKKNFNARNPSTNDLIYKPDRIKLRFRPSKNLKKIINK